MDSSIRKRPAEIENGAPPAKKQKTIPPTAILAVDGAESSSVSKSKTADTLASDGLRRGIALVLQKVGFESASADAMEEFISMTDKCKRRRYHHFRSGVSNFSDRYDVVRRTCQDARKYRP